mmetsp:Transcript_16084/g.29873  ORF Transcript_16084/g.29873 Transcript_16084/m.29873 type:complete len:200 (+) Transcript_16084:80-679(+)
MAPHYRNDEDDCDGYNYRAMKKMKREERVGDTSDEDGTTENPSSNVDIVKEEEKDEEEDDRCDPDADTWKVGISALDMNDFPTDFQGVLKLMDDLIKPCGDTTSYLYYLFTAPNHGATHPGKKTRDCLRDLKKLFKTQKDQRLSWHVERGAWVPPKSATNFVESKQQLTTFIEILLTIAKVALKRGVVVKHYKQKAMSG